MARRRRFGRVWPDPKHPGMWRSSKASGEPSDMANLSWAKNAVLLAAEREFEDRQRRAIDPPKCPEKRGVFSGPRSPIRANAPTGTYRPWGRSWCRAMSKKPRAQPDAARRGRGRRRLLHRGVAQ
jgi:hypothetical protein